MQPKSITHEKATELLDELVQSGKTVYLSLLFGESAALIQVWGKLNERPDGEYFITNDSLNFIFSPERYRAIYRRESDDAIALRFADASDQPINVVLIFARDEETLSTDELAEQASDWIN